MQTKKGLLNCKPVNEKLIDINGINCLLRTQLKTELFKDQVTGISVGDLENRYHRQITLHIEKHQENLRM